MMACPTLLPALSMTSLRRDIFLLGRLSLPSQSLDGQNDISQSGRVTRSLLVIQFSPCHPEVAAAAQESSRDCRLLKVGGGRQSRTGMRISRRSVTVRVITCHGRCRTSSLVECSAIGEMSGVLFALWISWNGCLNLFLIFSLVLFFSPYQLTSKSNLVCSFCFIFVSFL